MSGSFLSRMKSWFSGGENDDGGQRSPDEELPSILEKLTEISLSGNLPGPLRGPLHDLCRRCADLLESGGGLPEAAGALWPELKKLCGRLAQMDEKGRVKGRAESWSGEADRLYAALNGMNSKLAALARDGAA